MNGVYWGSYNPHLLTNCLGHKKYIDPTRWAPKARHKYRGINNPSETHIIIFPRTQMTHSLEDLTHKMVPVKTTKKEVDRWVLGISKAKFIGGSITHSVYNDPLGVSAAFKASTPPARRGRPGGRDASSCGGKSFRYIIYINHKQNICCI